MNRSPIVGIGAAVAVAVLTLPGVHAQQSSVGGTSQPGAGLSLAPATPAVRSPYLDAWPSTSEQQVAPGAALAMVVDIAPKKNVHVYAPGNPSYTAITLTVDPQPGIAVGAVKYPKAEDFFFAPLKEQVRVYSQPFRLTREVTVVASANATLALSAAPTLTIKGRLEYQACDDKVCYLPQTLPLTWTISLKR